MSNQDENWLTQYQYDVTEWYTGHDAGGAVSQAEQHYKAIWTRCQESVLVLAAD